MIRCNVAVTGLNAADDPAPGIAVIRSIRDSGQWEGKIIGLAYDALDTGIYDDSLADEVYLIPYPFDSVGLLERLKQISRKTKIDVLMPLLDMELLNLPGLVPWLEELGINSLLPTMSRVRLQLKLNLAEFCLKSDIRYPKQIAINSPTMIAITIKTLGLPVVVKGIIHGAHLASTVEEASAHFNAIQKRWGLPVILQEYIEGEEYNTDCLTDRNGEIVGAVSMRKLGMTDRGKAWSGVTVKDEGLLKLSEDILHKVNWVGPVELEFVKQRRSDSYYLLEINPRFGTWIFLTAHAGQNLPLAAIRVAMGEKLGRLPPYQAGVMFVRHSRDVICPVDCLASLTMSGELALNEIKKGVKEPCLT
jgi:carbamoyl-phosphate synthase large subunit